MLAPVRLAPVRLGSAAACGRRRQGGLVGWRQALQCCNSFVDLTQQRLDDGDPRIQIAFQFPLQIEHGDLPALSFDRRVAQRDRGGMVATNLGGGVVHFTLLADRTSP